MEAQRIERQRTKGARGVQLLLNKKLFTIFLFYFQLMGFIKSKQFDFVFLFNLIKHLCSLPKVKNKAAIISSCNPAAEHFNILHISSN